MDINIFISVLENMHEMNHFKKLFAKCQMISF